jgi:predicted nucleic acid-binding protein
VSADRLIVDTGFLVAFGRSADPLHHHAVSFLRRYSGRLITVAAVIVEASFFLSVRSKQPLLDWVHAGGLAVVETPVSAYPDLSAIIGKYEDREIDFADAALVWLADQSGVRSILTVDRADFEVYRLKGRKRFRLVAWC